MFGELWIDEDGALEKGLSSVPPELKDNFIEFMEKGYTIFRKAVPEKIIDQVVIDTHGFKNNPERYVMKSKGTYIDPYKLDKMSPGDRLIDLYAISPAAREAIYSSGIPTFLEFIFSENPIATQSISFEYGSQQAMHQDTAYVVSNKPLSLAASWLALEDVSEGTGELCYYPGSHRFDHFLFSDTYKSWSKARDGVEQHQEFLKRIHTLAKDQGIQKETFLAEKGDILVWHADLAHGGSRIADTSATRRSLVTHFVPQSVKAMYKKHIEKQYFELPYDGSNRAFFTSRHFDLNEVTDSTPAHILYDGGITKRRDKKL